MGPELLQDPLFLASELRAGGFSLIQTTRELKMDFVELRELSLTEHKRYMQYVHLAERNLLREAAYESVNIVRRQMRNVDEKVTLS